MNIVLQHTDGDVKGTVAEGNIRFLDKDQRQTHRESRTAYRSVCEIDSEMGKAA
jgi:hypothetical protein